MNCTLHLVGPFRLIKPNGQIIAIPSKRAKAILAIVALGPDQMRTRVWVQDKLWSKSGSKQGAASLRQELSTIRKIQSNEKVSLIRTDAEMIAIDQSGLHIDAGHTTDWARTTELLEGFDLNDEEFEDWLRVERVRWASNSPALVVRKADLGGAKLDASAFRKPSLLVDKIKATDRGDDCREFSVELYDELLTAFGALSNDISIHEVAESTTSAGAYRLTCVLRTRPRLILNARVVRQSDQKTVWSNRLTKDPEDRYHDLLYFCRQLMEGAQTALTDGQMSIIWSRHPTDQIAWEYYQRGRIEEAIGTKNGHRTARKNYRKALTIDSSFLPARIVEAFVLVDEIRLGWSDNPKSDLNYVKKQYSRIMEDAPREPYAHILGAYLVSIQGKFHDACTKMDEILSEIPENPELLAYSALLREANGEMDRAISMYQKALRITEYPPNWIRSNLGLAQLLAGRERDARHTLTTAIEGNPGSIRALIGLIALEVREENLNSARIIAEKVRAMQPSFSSITWRNPSHFRDSKPITRVAQELSRIGL